MDELMTYQSYGFSLILIWKSQIKDYRVSFHSLADVTESIKISVLQSIWINPENCRKPSICWYSVSVCDLVCQHPLNEHWTRVTRERRGRALVAWKARAAVMVPEEILVAFLFGRGSSFSIWSHFSSKERRIYTHSYPHKTYILKY